MRAGIITRSCSTGKYVEFVGWGRGKKPCIHNNFETILHKLPAEHLQLVPKK
jgi:hypothetical protein